MNQCAKYIPSLVAAICIFFSALSWPDDNLSIEGLEDISHEIAYINSFGKWEADGKHGIFRVILLDINADFPHSKLYLQWIEHDDSNNKKSGNIISSASIIEINNVGVYKLSVPRVSTANNGNALEISAINQYSQDVQNLQIWPAGPAKYSLHYTPSNRAKTIEYAVEKIPLTLDYYVRPTF